MRSLVAVAVGEAGEASRGPHGLAHWARVLENGMRLAAMTGASSRVVMTFAVLHDVRRRGRGRGIGRDPGHGARAAEFAASLPHDVLPLDHAEMALLVEAIAGHEAGRVAADTTIGTCWDADRLDAEPGSAAAGWPACTGAGADPDIRAWAARRRAESYVPADTIAEWGIDPTAVAIDGWR
jgi:uncharacterized protein